MVSQLCLGAAPDDSVELDEPELKIAKVNTSVRVKNYGRKIIFIEYLL